MPCTAWEPRSCPRGRGRERGPPWPRARVPTANLVPDDALVVPGHGVYAVFANGHSAAVNVGIRPDVFEATGRGLLIESHWIDFDADLYGRTCGWRS